MVANVLLIFLLLRKRKDMSMFHLTLLSLSLTDTIAAILFVFGANVFPNVSVQRNVMPVSLIVGFLKEYFVLSSLLHVLFIALQRYAAVSFPLRYKDNIYKTPRGGFITFDMERYSCNYKCSSVRFG